MRREIEESKKELESTKRVVQNKVKDIKHLVDEKMNSSRKINL